MPSQRWTLSGGQLRLSGTNQCVELRGGDSSSGTPVQLGDCAGAPGQNWTLTSDGMLRGRNGACLDVRGADPADGTAVQG